MMVSLTLSPMCGRVAQLRPRSLVLRMPIQLGEATEMGRFYNAICAILYEQHSHTRLFCLNLEIQIKTLRETRPGLWARWIRGRGPELL